MLAIEVEFLTGVSVAATPYRREDLEWPPHPDRLFQALVAAWGRNDPPDKDERRALEWLESLGGNSLEIVAPAARPRTVADIFVPPNDMHTSGKIGSRPPKKLATAINVVPEYRKNRQRRTFPATVVDPIFQTPHGAAGTGMAAVRYVWREAQGLNLHRYALENLAKEVTYLGHPHTLVRVALFDDTGTITRNGSKWIGPEGRYLRCPHVGRLDHLERRYRHSRTRAVNARPNPSLVTREFHPFGESKPPSTIFDSENFVSFEDAGGFCPSLSAFPLVAKRLRDALLQIADEKGIPIPPLLSGHDDDKRPTKDTHLSIVPLADIGWEHSQGRLMGLAVVWPRKVKEEDRRNVLRVLGEFIKEDGVNGSAGSLHFGRNGSWRLALSPEPARASMKFRPRYTQSAKRWGTVLPAVLDRHPKNRPAQDVAAIVERACFNLGLPREAVDGVRIDQLHKYAAVRAAPSIGDVSRSLPKDSPYRGRPLAHLILNFRRRIQGPVILGAGRFRGLGLCLPLA